MSGKKINQAPLQAVMQDNTELPANHEFQDYKVSGISIKAMLDNSGYLKGLPSGVSVTDQSNSRQWQLDQKRTELTIVAGSPATITPNALVSDKFIIQPAAAELQLQIPTNAPTVTQMGAAYAPFYFTVIARNATLGTAGFVSFSSAWTPLAGSQPYNNNSMNIIHCWYHPAGSFYRIETVLAGVLSDELEFDVLIEPSEVLTGGDTPVALIPALGANIGAILTELYEVFDYNSVPYATNVAWEIGYPSQPTATGLMNMSTNTRRNISLRLELGVNIDFHLNEPINWYVPVGNPTAGNSDIRYIGKYRIIDLN